MAMFQVEPAVGLDPRLLSAVVLAVASATFASRSCVAAEPQQVAMASAAGKAMMIFLASPAPDDLEDVLPSASPELLLGS